MSKKSKAKAKKAASNIVLESKLASWDSTVPVMPNDLAKANFQYYGLEPIPGKAGWVRDFVAIGPDGAMRHLQMSLSVPEGYWVPISMLNWSITAYQHIRRLMLKLEKGSESAERRVRCAAFANYSLQRIWWYIRSRDIIKSEIRLEAAASQIVGGLNELVWREAQNFVDNDPPERKERLECMSAQQDNLNVLCDPDRGFVGA